MNDRISEAIKNYYEQESKAAEKLKEQINDETFTEDENLRVLEKETLLNILEKEILDTRAINDLAAVLSSSSGLQRATRRVAADGKNKYIFSLGTGVSRKFYSLLLRKKATTQTDKKQLLLPKELNTTWARFNPLELLMKTIEIIQ